MACFALGISQLCIDGWRSSPELSSCIQYLLRLQASVPGYPTQHSRAQHSTAGHACHEVHNLELELRAAVPCLACDLRQQKKAYPALNGAAVSHVSAQNTMPRKTACLL